MRAACLQWLSRVVNKCLLSPSVFLDAVYFTDHMISSGSDYTDQEVVCSALAYSLLHNNYNHDSVSDLLLRSSLTSLGEKKFHPEDFINHATTFALFFGIDHTVTEQIIKISDHCCSTGLLTDAQGITLITTSINLACHFAFIDSLPQDCFGFALAISFVVAERFNINTDIMLSSFHDQIDLVNFINLFHHVADCSVLFEEPVVVDVEKGKSNSPVSLHKYLCKVE
ncbi:hypothetical protein P9112_009858 [Eukaryota sp. TZLM1-RC]